MLRFAEDDTRGSYLDDGLNMGGIRRVINTGRQALSLGFIVNSFQHSVR